ncbi:MAG TPA: hypothetical protein VHJ82_08675 [Actinomycetota bacterium]|nr:hypothetical protein [Actinomycetota bacterium]
MKRHPLDAWSLVFGIAFAALGATFLNTGIDIAHLSGIWLLPLPLLFAGLVLLGLGLSRVKQPPVPESEEALVDSSPQESAPSAAGDVSKDDTPEL